MAYELHPLCTLFPRLTGAEFDALRDDIKANGLRQPIILHDGMILDGGNRYRACLEAGVEPSFTEYAGGNIVAFVLSANLHRRHMTPGQQAAIVASAQDWAKAQPAHRPAEKECNVAPLSTVADRAAQSGASVRTQKMADKVAKTDPELAKKVAQGEVSLPKAVQQVTAGRTPPPALPVPSAAGAPPAPTGDDPGADDPLDVDMTDVLNDAQRTIDQLHERIKSLTQSDLAAQLDREIQVRQGIEARLAQEMERASRLDGELRSYGKWAADLRKLLNVNGGRSQVIAAVKSLLKGGE